MILTKEQIDDYMNILFALGQEHKTVSLRLSNDIEFVNTARYFDGIYAGLEMARDELRRIIVEDLD